MAGTSKTYNTDNVANNAGDIWYDLAIPGAGARITLDATTKTPDSIAHPSAKHAGATQEGSKLSIKSTMTNYFVDEFRGPIIKNVDEVQMMIAASLVGVTKHELMAFLLPGVGTYGTAAGYKQIQIGQLAIVYSCVALIFPLIEDTTKVGVFNIYKSLNDAGVEFDVGRKKLGFTPVNMTGHEITSRVVTDTLGNYWKEIA